MIGRHCQLFAGLRPARDDDLEALRDIYVSTRWEELQQAPWTDAQRLTFLHQQFAAQHSHYRSSFDAASWMVLEVHGTIAGRLYLDERPDEVRIIDIALLPGYRGQGLGRRVLLAIIDFAEQRALPVRIHVEKHNPAMRLYRRLGFVDLEDAGVYLLMERPAVACGDSVSQAPRD